MAIESFDDLLRGLREHPEWVEQLRGVVLTERLLELPDTVAALAVAQRDTQGQVLALTQQVTVLTGRFDQLTGRFDQLTGRFDQLTGRFDQLTEQVGALAGRVNQLAGRVDRLAAAQEATEVRLQGLMEQLSIVASRADRAIGYLVEQQYRTKAHAYFQRIARRVRVLTPDELDDLLDPGIAAGTIDEREAEEVRWADVVVRGRRDGEPVLLVVEASAVVDRADVDRAVHRAGVLSRTGVSALPVVAGERVLPEALLAADRQDVWVVTDGRAQGPRAA